jgi:hypothetical protein
MGRRWLLVPVLLLGAVAGLSAVENGRQNLTIVRAEQKARDRVIYYVVNTPIYRQDLYFEVEVRVSDTLLVAEYEPNKVGETLPESWKPGARVQGKIEGRHVLLRRPNGTDVRFVITKRTAVPSDKSQRP